MEKKGSITVFLALILSLILSLVCTSIQSVQAAAARTQVLNSLDIGLYSLFGQYDRMLLEDYDLFFIDGAQGGSSLNLGKIYDNMESYIKPVLKQNSQKLTLKQGGFTGYRLATDQNGEVFYRQAVTCMKQTLGSQGIQKLLGKLSQKEQSTKQAEESGKQSEQGNTLQSYDTEMDTASKNSEVAKEEQQKEQEGAETSSGEKEDGFSDGEQKPQVVNPIPILKRIRQMSLLDLVVPAGKGISDQECEKGQLLSERQTQEGMTMPGMPETDNSRTSQLLFQQYLSDRMGSYQNPASEGLKYQMEYILAGKNSDRKNLEKVVGRLLLIREGINSASLVADSVKMAQVHTLALAIAAGFLIPPAAVIIEAALVLCWSFAESVVDLRELLHGGKVPLVKNASNWQLSLENLPYLLEKMDTERKNAENGMSYEDYLQVLLLSQSKKEKLERGMDMIEVHIRSHSGRKNFRLDNCLEAVEASVDVEANRIKTFTVTRQYSYI